jgi:hypothetical protein
VARLPDIDQDVLRGFEQAQRVLVCDVFLMFGRITRLNAL